MTENTSMTPRRHAGTMSKYESFVLLSQLTLTHGNKRVIMKIHQRIVNKPCANYERNIIYHHYNEIHVFTRLFLLAVTFYIYLLGNSTGFCRKKGSLSDTWQP